MAGLCMLHEVSLRTLGRTLVPGATLFLAVMLELSRALLLN